MAAETTVLSTSDAMDIKSDPGTPAVVNQDKIEGRNVKIDQITSLQDGIDGLSLAMFEALRGLRDAVAPESGSLGAAAATPNNNGNNTTEQPDTDDLWHAYKAGDPEVIDMVQTSLAKMAKKSGDTTPTLKLTSREDFIRWHAKMSMEKDTELVTKLSSKILEKSAAIDRQLEALPGMHRTRAEQMEYLQQLIEANREAADELQEIYTKAQKKRDSCRQFIKDKTSEALGIEEEL